MAIKLNNRILFLSLLFISPIYFLIIKLGIGHVNTTLVAAIPVLLLFLISYIMLILILFHGRWKVGKIQYLDLFVIIYFSLGIIQTLNPHLPNILYGVRGIHEHLLWISSYFIARLMFYSEHDCETLIKVIMVASLISCCYGILTMYIGVERFESSYLEFIAREDILFVKRSVGTIASPFGFGLLCAIGLGASSSLNSPFYNKRFGLFVAFICFVGGIIIASSRLVILGVFFSFAFVVVLQRNKLTFRKVMKASALIILVFFILTLAIKYFNDTLYVKRLLSILSFQNESNLLARYYVWRNLLPFAETNPLGYGTGALGSACYRYGSVVGNNLIADNNYIEILIEQGALGVILYLLIITSSIIASARLFKRDKTGISRFVLFISVLFAVSSVGAPPLKAFPGNLYFWTVLGAFSAYQSKSIIDGSKVKDHG